MTLKIITNRYHRHNLKTCFNISKRRDAQYISEGGGDQLQHTREVNNKHGISSLKGRHGHTVLLKGYDAAVNRY